MTKRVAMAFIAVALLVLTCSMAYAQQADPWNTLYEKPIGDAATKVRELLMPFSAKAGFPDTRPAGLENATYEELYNAAAAASKKGSEIFAGVVKIFTPNIRWYLSPKYFQKRLEIGAQLYPERKGHEKAFEFLCRDFAAAADRGFEELRYWALPEGMVIDMIWFKAIQEGFMPVKAKMAQAVMPENIAPAKAKALWKKTAETLVEAGNEAGIASTKVGSMGFAAFPAWRLKNGIKYFKAAAKAAVVDKWHLRNNDPVFWVKACKQLKTDIAVINAEMEEFLALMQQK